MSTLDEITAGDESWKIARQLAQKHLQSASLTFRLIRNGWGGAIDEREFVKLFNFTRLSPSCLIHAANMPVEQVTSAEQLQHAVQTLGVPLASVIVGVHLSCSVTVMSHPPPLWDKTLREIMNFIEIGYRFGSRVSELGPAVGTLAGFGLGCGLLVALLEAPKQLAEYLKKPTGRPNLEPVLGTEVSQISGFMLQQLGFGHEVAIGVAFGSGASSKAKISFTDQLTVWMACCRWIESLRFSRNYPGDIKFRTLFPSITPPALGSGARNHSLETLYSEVAPCVREGSKWVWHLPRPSYELTQDLVIQNQSK